MNTLNTKWASVVLVTAGVMLGPDGSRVAYAEARGLQAGDHNSSDDDSSSDDGLDAALAAVLNEAGFTGAIEATLPARLGRPVDAQLADLGRLIFHDKIQSLHNDNSCAGCHAASFGFGDSQHMAIGVDNNGFVGPHRAGPRNFRKSPTVIDSGFYPKLMLNGRFEAVSGDPFDNSAGFKFPPPHDTFFPPNDPIITTLLAAQAHLPVPDLSEMGGFTGTAGTIGPVWDQFDDGHGDPIPPADGDGVTAGPIRDAVTQRFNANAEYRALFGNVFNGGVPVPEGDVTFGMVAQAVAEFQIALTFTDAPIDRFARGEHEAMTNPQKRGALLFFGQAGCVRCHTVAGPSNEMFSDFDDHVVGVPQIAPVFGIGSGNVLFDGPGLNEDFGREQISGDVADRYKFRTSPLRNAAVQPAFFHNGAFTTLEDAVRHHLDPVNSALSYDPIRAGIPDDLVLMGPIEPVLARLDPLLQEPIELHPQEFRDLVEFVRHGLLDARARRESLCALVPATVPSGLPVSIVQGCED